MNRLPLRTPVLKGLMPLALSLLLPALGLALQPGLEQLDVHTASPRCAAVLTALLRVQWPLLLVVTGVQLALLISAARASRLTDEEQFLSAAFALFVGFICLIVPVVTAVLST